MNLIEAIELHLPRGFTIEQKIGRGGTSSVYRARRAGSDERIVVKVMQPGTVSPASLERFFREIEVLKKLQHPRIIPILESGEASGSAFFTMPYIAGETLWARLKAVGRLELRDALLVARDVADALSHAHGKGVVHRDVKPGNILLGVDGAYLMDFGFASGSAAAARGDGAAPRTIVGTPGYMSPEQMGGRWSEDRRSDFFSLGCVMYEMLAGQSPFPARAGRAHMHRRHTEAAPDVRALRPEVPEAVAAIVRRNLDLHPSGRFVGAGSLRAALDAALQDTGGD
jgi:serine/threonine-protein kinase